MNLGCEEFLELLGHPVMAVTNMQRCVVFLNCISIFQNFH